MTTSSVVVEEVPTLTDEPDPPPGGQSSPFDVGQSVLHLDIEMQDILRIGLRFFKYPST